MTLIIQFLGTSDHLPAATPRDGGEMDGLYLGRGIGWRGYDGIGLGGCTTPTPDDAAAAGAAAGGAAAAVGAGAPILRLLAGPLAFADRRLLPLRMAKGRSVKMETAWDWVDFGLRPIASFVCLRAPYLCTRRVVSHTGDFSKMKPQQSSNPVL